MVLRLELPAQRAKYFLYKNIKITLDNISEKIVRHSAESLCYVENVLLIQLSLPAVYLLSQVDKYTFKPFECVND